MTDKFTNFETQVCADWLNQVDRTVFTALAAVNTTPELVGVLGAPPATRARNVVDDFGVTGDGSPEDVQRIRDVLDSDYNLYFPGMVYKVSGEPFNITGADRTIVAENAIFRRETTDTEGGFFRINAIRSTISGFRLLALRKAVGSATGYAIEIEDCSDMFIKDIVTTSVSGVIRAGHDPLSNCNRILINNITGNWWAGHLQDPILIEDGAGILLTNFNINADSNSTDASTVSTVALRTRSGGLIDTVYLSNVRLQCNTTIGGGMKYGLELDASLGNVTNTWCVSCNFDKSNTAGIRLVNNGTTDTYLRNTFISDVRVDDAYGGHGLLVESSSTDADALIHDATIKGCLFRYNDGPAIKFINTGSGTIEGITVSGCTCSATDTATIESAVEIGTSGITVIGCQFTATNNTVAVDYAFKITDDVTDLVLSSNNVIHPAEYILHYPGGYSTPDYTRQITPDYTVTVTPVTTTASLASTDSRTVYTNEGDADGANVTLPSASAGLTYTAYVQAAQILTITAATGDTIRIASNVTATGGSVSSNVVGSALVLVAVNATEWVATSAVGSWSF